jgi:transcription initiation factor TFIIB
MDFEDEHDIWADFKAYEASIVVEKPVIEVTNNFFCTCGGQKAVIDNMPTCTSCGVIDRSCIDDSAEWATGGNQEDCGSGGKDPARCGMPSDTELFSAQWGAGLVINVKNASYEVRRMAKISFHSSMNHKDRSLFHAYKDIELAALTNLNLPEMVIRDAKVLYKKFNAEKLTRGAVRAGIKANCVFMACKCNNVTRTIKEIADAFGIPTKDVSRTTLMFKETLEPSKKTVEVTRPNDILPRLLNDFEIDFELKKKLRIKCTRLSKQIEPCVELMGKTPNSIASVVILIVFDGLVPKKEICEKCKISVPTMNKIEAIVKKFLSENK